MEIRAERSLFFVSIVFLSVCLLGCDASPTARSSSSKLSSEELGVIEEMSRILNSINTSVESINKNILAAEKAKMQQNYGIANTYYESANKLLYQWRNYILNVRSSDKPILIYPDSMEDIGSSIDALVNLWAVIPANGELSSDQLNQILFKLRDIVEADKAFYRTVKARKSNPDLVKPKVTLAFELKPFPFMIEVLHGEFKIKQSFSLGPINGILGAANSGTRTGITKLVLVNNGNARIYAVGNRRLSFDVPASHIDINGSVMTITAIN